MFCKICGEYEATACSACINDALLERDAVLTHLQQAVALLERARDMLQEFDRRIRKLRELLGEFMNSPVVFDDERLDYVEIQVSKRTFEEAKKLLGGGGS